MKMKIEPIHNKLDKNILKKTHSLKDQDFGFILFTYIPSYIYMFTFILTQQSGDVHILTQQWLIV